MSPQTPLSKNDLLEALADFRKGLVNDFATKADLAGLATTADISILATKDDLKALQTEMHQMGASITDSIVEALDTGYANWQRRRSTS